MKAIFIAYNQAYGEEIVELLDDHGQRGFTQWIDIQGRGGEQGEPHYGSHAWPTENYAILTIVPDDKAPLFQDPDFWKDYNIIEPSESLEHAVARLRK